MLESLLTETDVSKHLRVSVACMRRWRLEHRGPRFLKIGSLVRYRPEDVEEWIKAQPAGGDLEAVASPASISIAAPAGRM
jgi:predicted DNA-binding transcriptional regulator AlpA